MEHFLLILATLSSMFLSSVAGYGGSLILVPALAALLGPQQGIALAALLLAWNNVFKVAAYRRTIPLREGWPLIVVTGLGALAGGLLLISVPSQVVYVAIGAVTVGTLVVELTGGHRLLQARRAAAVPMMTASGFLSGISGTSGPLKGVAIRSLGLPRLEHVGLAAVVSLVGDTVKVELFAGAGLLADVRWSVVVSTVPLMPVAAWVGREMNRRIDEATFRWVFWSVVGGYVLRMFGAWI
jgi:uncharacterized membrane protein YfcA